MIIKLFQFLSFLFITFLSTIEVFKVFSYNQVITLIQSLNLVYRIFNFEVYSLVIKIAILINSAVLLEILIPALRFITANVLELIAEADPIKISVLINNTFF